MKKRKLVLFLFLIAVCIPYSCDSEDPIVPVKTVSLNESHLTITEGDLSRLNVTISPEGATNKKVTWKSSNPSIVFVDQQGEITANTAGVATITVTSESSNKIATCDVIVEAKTVSVTDISLNRSSLKLVEGGSDSLTYMVEPVNATNKNVFWESSDELIVSVSQQGKLIANKSGGAIISVTSENGSKTATCNVIVERGTVAVTGVSLSKASLEVAVGDIESLIHEIEPANATNKNVFWESNDDSIVSVDQKGRITAIKEGVATITVTTEDGDKTATINIIVVEKAIPPTAVSLDKKELYMLEGDSEQLTPTIVPSNATYKDLSWKSNDELVATVDASGKVTALQAGVTVITVSTKHGNKTDVCAVSVEPNIISVTGVTLNETSITIAELESVTLIAMVEPDNATNKNLVWKSDNSNIAIVDSKGSVSGISAGATTVTATTEDGGKVAVCEVTVARSWLSLSQSSLHLSGAGGSLYVDVTGSNNWSVVSKPYWATVTPSTGYGAENGASRVEISVSRYNGTNAYRAGEIVFKLDGIERAASFTIDQYNFVEDDGDYIKVQSSTVGDGIDLVFVGDGYTIEDIGNGKFLKNLNDAVNHFFDIEPYRTYRDYFDVYIVYAFSEESGISDHNTTRNTKFSSKYENPNTTRMTTNIGKCFEYARKVPLRAGLPETLITVVTNSTRYAGTAWLLSDGTAVSIVPVSNNPYPYDFRAVLQHEAGGHGFGKLADEYVNYEMAIPASEIERLTAWQQYYNHYKNVDITNDPSKILWSHFINDPSYSYVGAYEGGHLYSSGVWRPEAASLMINNITYLNAPSRELIVRRIKKLAGETFSFEEFKRRDVREIHSLTRSANVQIDKNMLLPPPILIEVD